MKQQVVRLSPHQNGKVFGVLTAIVSFVVLVPFMLFFAAVSPTGGGNAPPLLMLLAMPVIYLVVGYVCTAVGCLIYNFMFTYLGGFEYVARSMPDA